MMNLVLLVILVVVPFLNATFTGHPVVKGKDIKCGKDPSLMRFEVVSKNSTCTKDSFAITIMVNQSFNGVIYAKGFPRTKSSFEEKECFALGKASKKVDLKIDPRGCGVRVIPINDYKMAYVVTLVLQSDKYLQQLTNLDVPATCMLAADEITIGKAIRKKSRGSRKVQMSIVESKLVDGIKAWMEVKTEQGKSRVGLGSIIKVFVKTELPKYMAVAVTECTAYDGLKERSQKLTDVNGCSLDKSLMPPFIDYTVEKDVYESTETTTETEKGYNIKGEWVKPTLRVSGTTFTAFKFSDTANLHLRCKVIACRFSCPLIPCNATNATATHADSTGATILDSIIVFNSIEVYGPGIDNSSYAYESGDTENYYCFSSNKIGFAFAIAGAFFLFGVFAAILASMKPRHFRTCGNRRIIIAQNRNRVTVPVRQYNAPLHRNNLV